MHRHAFAALSASALVCLLSAHVGQNSLRIGVQPAAASPAPDPVECLRFEKTQMSKSIDLEAKSSCDDKLECSVAYSVRCEDRHGKTTTQTDRTVRFSVGAGKTETLSLSAESCASGWTIDNVHWSCHTTQAR